MVVTTLQPVTTNLTATVTMETKALPDTNTGTTTTLVNEQCVVSKSMLGRHRRTLSPDKILFLKVPTVPTPPIDGERNPANIPRAVISLEDMNRKREAVEQPRVNAPPLKKARLIVLSSPSLPIRRTVRFEPQDSSKSGPVKTQVRFFERVEACDVANIWWSGEEMLEIMNREKSAVSVMSYCCDHYTSEVLNLMKIARNKDSLPGMANAESSSPVWVASSPARGLERDIVQGFKQRKRQVIKKVLESQRVLKSGRHHETGEEAPPELLTQLLSNQYQKWSHPMVRFAQVLAEGDAQVVINNAVAAA